jgi:hypothetical protein
LSIKKTSFKYPIVPDFLLTLKSKFAIAVSGNDFKAVIKGLLLIICDVDYTCLA